MYLEDVKAGQEFRLGPREITLEEIRAFAQLTRDRNPLHLDTEFARGTPFGKPVAHGMLTLSLALGLWSEAGYTQGSLAALVGLTEVRFLKPVFPGDSISLRTMVASVTSSHSRPEVGFATFLDEVTNQHGQMVVTFQRTLLLAKRPGA